MPGEDDQTVWRGVRPIGGIRGVWPEIDAVRVFAEAWNAGAVTEIVYTVPGGKILFLSSGSMFSRKEADGSGYVTLMERDAGDVEKRVIIHSTYAIKGQLSINVSFFPAVEIAAGYDIIVKSDVVDAKGRGIINGWLEDE